MTSNIVNDIAKINFRKTNCLIFKYIQISNRTHYIRECCASFSFMIYGRLATYFFYSHLLPPYFCSFFDNSTSSLAISSEEIKPRDLAQTSRSTISTRLFLTAFNFFHVASSCNFLNQQNLFSVISHNDHTLWI